MERTRKRKAAPGASPETEGSAAKRAKLPQDAESATRIGLQFIEQVKSAKDKTGRSISDLFLELPDKAELKDYYQVIKLPIAISTIENKLARNAYTTLSQIEGDLKRMVSNAKIYNEDTSIVYQDAERIRKMVSNFMTKNNPAYKDPGYVAVPTPVPGEGASNGAQVADTSREGSEQPRKPTVTISLKNRKPSMAAASPGATDDTPDDTPAPSGDFIGKSFQQAQEQIINEMIFHTVDGMQDFHPFVHLPPRSLTSYYQTIKKPVSLTALKKKTKGQHGREKPTGVSDFKTWDAFEEEVSYVWANARYYNEDGSEISILAGTFEDYFKERLALAKQQVDEPQQPKITLKGRPKPVLHLGSKSSPAPAPTSTTAPAPVPASTPGVTVDNDALARQKQAVQAGMNGHQTPAPQRPSLPPSRSASQVPAATPMKRTQSGQASSPPLTAAAVKSEKSVAPSPSLTKARLSSTAPEPKPSQPTTSMPPPAPRVASASPHPSQAVLQTPQPPSYVPAPTTFVDHFSRTKPVAEALMPNINIVSHPNLKLLDPYKLDVAPSDRFTQQSITIMLPATHYYIQIAPTLHPMILMTRQYKLFVTVNGLRLMATTKPALNGDINATKQVYEAALLHGVNRIEVEIVAATAGRGNAALPLETEKLSVYATLMRA